MENTESDIGKLPDYCGVEDVTLLSIEEIKQIKDKSILGIKKYWWLRSPGRRPYLASYVRYDGRPIREGHFVCRVDYGIRPALKIKNIDLLGHDRFELGGFTWTPLSEVGYALCDDIVDTGAFQKDDNVPAPNDYLVSDIKKRVDEWAEENIMSAVMS